MGGECGHMWRVLHQYMDTTLNGPADFLEVPVSPVTGTRFENTRSTKMVHICEFTADLIRNGKIQLDASRNDRWNVTFHDSCNPARSMGLIEEPRYILRNVVNQFHEMPENTIREQTFCCGSRKLSDWGPTKISRCGCAAGFRAPTPCATSRTNTV